jgi:hypothetical protein
MISFCPVKFSILVALKGPDESDTVLGHWHASMIERRELACTIRIVMSHFPFGNRTDSSENDVDFSPGMVPDASNFNVSDGLFNDWKSSIGDYKLCII